MSFWKNKKPLQFVIILILLASTLLTPNLALSVSASQSEEPAGTGEVDTAAEDTQLANNVFVPLLYFDFPWESPFGVENTVPLLNSNSLLTRAIDLQVGWARLGFQISWRKLQPNPGDAIQWSLLATFEEELRGLKDAGIHPIVTVKDNPYWSLSSKARDKNGNPTSCGAIDEQYFDEFAAFASQLVERYKTEEFNVHDWELGNEPDVDPTLTDRDNQFGCWGDINDQYYGGEQYGNMLKSVTPAIRKVDPSARVWVGGLLLASPASNPADGAPELFLKGILETGAAPYFDVVPYHWYPSYSGSGDWDYTPYNPWYSWGGGTIGKARFLRQIMAEYGIQKPLFLDETGFSCKENTAWCEPPNASFFDSQASHLVRFFVRGLSEKVSGFVWYTLNGPGWRYTGLLDSSQMPKSVFNAFQVLSDQLRFARFQYQVDYGPDIEAYSFRQNSERIDVLWAKDEQTVQVLYPINKFISAVRRDGTILPTPPQIGQFYRLNVDFSPIYIIHYP